MKTGNEEVNKSRESEKELGKEESLKKNWKVKKRKKK